jgi:hypothetical protein
MAAGHPQADSVALLALADALASYYVFGATDWDACVRDALAMARWALDNSTGAEAGDTDLKAIQFVAEWLTRSSLHFEDSAEMDRMERCREIWRRPGEQDFVWCVFSSVLDKALEAENYDRQKTLRHMDDEGALAMGSVKRFTMQRRLKGGTRRYCVCIDNARLEVLLDRGSGAAAVSASSAGDPR